MSKFIKNLRDNLYDMRIDAVVALLFGVGAAVTGNLAIYFAPLAVKAFEERFSWQAIGNVYVQANLASEAIVWGLVPAIPLTLYALL